MKTLFIQLFAFVLIATSCSEKKPTKNLISNVDATAIDINKDSTIYDLDVKHTDPNALEFRDVFNFRYQDGDKTGQVSIYHDAINELVMYYPEDEMTDFVIIDKAGLVYFFYTGEHGDKSIQLEKIEFTPDDPEKQYPSSTRFVTIDKIDDRFVVDQSAYSLPTIDFQGYHLEYLQYNDGLDFYITDQFDGNSEQLHAFGQLITTDWNYPLPLGDLTQKISHKQFIGKVVHPEFEIEFLHYTPTTIWAPIAEYQLIVENDQGEFVEERIPLMDYVEE